MQISFFIFLNMLMFVTTMSGKTALADSFRSQLYFDKEHLELNKPMWAAIDIRIPKNNVFVYANANTAYPEPIVSMDARKYFFITGPFYPAPKRTGWKNGATLVGFQDSVTLLFRIENEPGFFPTRWNESIDLEYDIKAYFCNLEAYSCKRYSEKGEHLLTISAAKAAQTRRADQIYKNLGDYPISFDSKLFTVRMGHMTPDEAEILIDANAEKVFEINLSYDFHIAPNLGFENPPIVQRLSQKSLSVRLRKKASQELQQNLSGLLTITGKISTEVHEIRTQF